MESFLHLPQNRCSCSREMCFRRRDTWGREGGREEGGRGREGGREGGGREEGERERGREMGREGGGNDQQSIISLAAHI